MLIVEGPDCAGKTTLCKKLLEKLPTHIYAHFSRLPDQFDFYRGYTDRISHFIVQDRFHLSEIVYAAVRNEPTKLSPEKYRLVDATARLCGAFTVLVTAVRRLVIARWDQNQMYSLDDTLSAANKFANLDSAFPEYTIDIDHVVACGSDHPFATDDDIEVILVKYLERENELRLLNLGYFNHD